MASRSSSVSRGLKRKKRHLAYGIVMTSLSILNGQSVVAEGPILPSTVSSLSSSVSKARIVVPSLYQDDAEFESSDDFKIRQESFGPESSTAYNPIAFLSREESMSDGGEELVNTSLPNGVPAPSKTKFKKTGTTIAGCVVQGGNGDGPYVVLAADTRATEGTLVADKTCDKIHKLASNCRCCGAGTSADLDKTTRQVLYQIALRELQNKSIGNVGSQEVEQKELLYPDHGDAEPLLWMRPVSIEVLCGIFQDMLFRNGGNLGANLIVGGVWNKKAYLRAIHPHGSTDINLPFTALGSGGLAAMAVLEEGYKSSLTLEEGVDLVQRAILSGIRNDLGSGSQVDLCVIDPNGNCQQTRAVIPEEELLPDGSTTKDPSLRTNRLLQLLGRENTKEEEEDDQETALASTSTNSGVNGFGNQPFAVENTKQRMLSVEMDRAKQKETWDRVLGL